MALISQNLNPVLYLWKSWTDHFVGKTRLNLNYLLLTLIHLAAPSPKDQFTRSNWLLNLYSRVTDPSFRRPPLSGIFHSRISLVAVEMFFHENCSKLQLKPLCQWSSLTTVLFSCKVWDIIYFHDFRRRKFPRRQVKYEWEPSFNVFKENESCRRETGIFSSLQSFVVTTELVCTLFKRSTCKQPRDASRVTTWSVKIVWINPFSWAFISDFDIYSQKYHGSLEQNSWKLLSYCLKATWRQFSTFQTVKDDIQPVV